MAKIKINTNFLKKVRCLNSELPFTEKLDSFFRVAIALLVLNLVVGVARTIPDSLVSSEGFLDIISSIVKVTEDESEKPPINTIFTQENPTPKNKYKIPLKLKAFVHNIDVAKDKKKALKLLGYDSDSFEQIKKLLNEEEFEQKNINAF